jgi:hypothetical protein
MKRNEKKKPEKPLHALHAALLCGVFLISFERFFFCLLQGIAVRIWGFPFFCSFMDGGVFSRTKAKST